MIKLEFNVFQKIMEKDVLNGYFPNLHCMTGEDRFILLVRSADSWKYYTEMLYSTLVSFAEQENQEPEEALEMFRINL